MKHLFIAVLTLIVFTSCKKEGVSSPKFVNYENYDGSKTSLDDLKGKYVYVDVWATWCGPCRAEIPHLQKLEKEYHDKNIAFVSISVDDVKDKAVWKKMISDNKMGGIQLFAGKDKTFLDGYKITEIPRFILIDPKGNIIQEKAPNPSDKSAVKELFSKI